MRCTICSKPIKKTIVEHKGQKLEAYKCTACGEEIFTEEQFAAAVRKMDLARLKESYSKNVIKIGHSLGITFPKDVVRAFDLKGKKVEVVPNMKKGVIEIRAASP